VFVDVTDVTLTDIFQYQSEFVDVTDNFQYQSEFVDVTDVTLTDNLQSMWMPGKFVSIYRCFIYKDAW
jgi:hypothetical protein